MKKKQSFEKRHDEFQFGHNPMKMTEFEKSRILLEKEERESAKRKYVKGIQGIDGGSLREGY